MFQAKKGFTVIEGVIAVAILAIFAVVAYDWFTGYNRDIPAELDKIGYRKAKILSSTPHYGFGSEGPDGVEYEAAAVTVNDQFVNIRVIALWGSPLEVSILHRENSKQSTTSGGTP